LPRPGGGVAEWVAPGTATTPLRTGLTNYSLAQLSAKFVARHVNRKRPSAEYVEPLPLTMHSARSSPPSCVLAADGSAGLRSTPRTE